MAVLFHPSLPERLELPDETFAAIVAKTDPACTWACPAGEVHARADDLLVALSCAVLPRRSFRSLVQTTRAAHALRRLGRAQVCVLAPQEILDVARARRTRYDSRRAA